DIFSWQIDFLTEVRKGDKFKVVYKQLEYENGYKKDAEILIAKYSGKITNEHIALYFESKDGNFRGYFSEDAKSVKKIFLRAPLNYRKVSSGFAKKRFHPILRIFRPHHGTDFVAPIGTPIVTIGDGIVEYSGWKGGYGNVVIIRHNSTYKTLYGHLKSIAKGIKPGVRVFQGQIIGYLGSTGISTG
ncbi:MAG: peptidoglycan DD-metalloendopeptidase family protein, partial [Endomicrobiia bacterium]